MNPRNPGRFYVGAPADAQTVGILSLPAADYIFRPGPQSLPRAGSPVYNMVLIYAREGGRECTAR